MPEQNVDLENMIEILEEVESKFIKFEFDKKFPESYDRLVSSKEVLINYFNSQKK